MFQKLKEKYKYAKLTLNEIRFKLKYIYLPIYATFNVLIFLTCFILFIYAKDPLFTIIALLGVSLVSSVGFITYARIVRKKEVLIEAEKLNVFFRSNLLNEPICEYELPTAGGESVVKLLFNEDGIKIADLSYSYKAFDCALYTSNFMFQVNLIALFTRNEKGDKEDGESSGVTSFSLPFNLNLMSIMHKFDIELKNPDVLKFIKDYPEIAAKQILQYGKIQENYKEEEKKQKNMKQVEQKIANKK